MGKLTDDQIDKLFQDHLHGFEKESPVDSWPTLKKEVARRNFFSFGWKHINIYQILFVLSAFLILFYLMTIPNSHGTLQKSTDNPAPTSIAKDSVESFAITKNSTLKEENSSTTKIKSRRNQKILIEKESVNDSLLLPPTPLVSDNEPSVVKNTEPKKEKKIITVIKRDTLIIKDTLKIKRRRKDR